MMQRLEDEEDPAVELDDGLLESDRVHYGEKPPEAQAPSRLKTRLLILGVIIFAIANGFMAWQIFGSGPPAPAQQQSLAPTSWRMPRAESPTPRAGVAAAELGGKLYVIGGYTEDGKASKAVEFFDPVTETWSAGATLPEALSDAAAVSYNKELYVLGGSGADEKSRATVYAYDGATWHVAPAMPGATASAAAAVVAGRVYVAGGFDAASKPTDKVYSFSAADGAWREETSLSQARDRFVAASVNDKLYIFGGSYSGKPLQAAEMYDPGAKTWKRLADMPTARLDVAAAVIQQKIYLVGGQNASDTLDVVEAYNPATNTWSNAPTMSSPASGLAAISFHNNLYALMGRTLTSFSGLVQILSFQAKQ